MSEKLLIIAEKPGAAKAFSAALGGMNGIFNGNEYAIVNLFGHILMSPVPDEVALPQYKDTVGKFSNITSIPWNPQWFDFHKKVPSSDSSTRVMRDIAGYLRNGYIPVIASDIDPSGEGDLLVREVLIALNYRGKTYREYHTDETPNGLQKSMSNLKIVDETDPVYVMAFSRSNMDYLTQQLTRVATMTIQNKGYKLPAPVPMGRLKSAILTILGDQLKAIAEYKPSSVFESRYKLGSLVLSRNDMPNFKTKDEWNADGLPFESNVREVKQVPGYTIPPKALTLSQLAGLMSKKGMKSKQFLDTYQKMYEAGYMTYPRTEDDFVTPEQFNEMLPIVDTILNLLALPTAAFTHRQPRDTHVKTGGAHGALRPGLKIPNTIDELDSLFGPHASDIYRAAGERFLMMFLENTEWVKHVYETTDTEKPFTGTIKIITKQGVVDPNESQDDVATQLPNLQELAKLYPHEIKSKKPQAATVDWLLNQLVKVDVGTESTRVQTIAAMSGNKDTYPIREGKTLELSLMGQIGYQAAAGTVIGSVDGTRQMESIIKDVKNGLNPNDAYDAFTKFIAQDAALLANLSLNYDSLNIPKAAPRVMASGVWNGEEVQFNKVYMGHEFTDDEVDTLLNNGEVLFETKGKDGNMVKVKGILAKQEYKGNPFVGFKGEFVREGYITGTWNGREVTIKGSYMDHVFSDTELETLFNGGSINVQTHKDGKTYDLTGKLEEQEYQGRKFVGFKGVFPTREGYVKGVWNGKEITFKGSYMDHTFTPDEINKLLAGGTIHVTTHKDDKTYELDGKLEVQEYQGRKFVGFKGQFANTPREGYVTGVWKGNNVSFKGEFMKHVFTDGEIQALLNGENITFQGTSSKGSVMSVTGKLENQTYQGRKFVGFKADFGKK